MAGGAQPLGSLAGQPCCHLRRAAASARTAPSVAAPQRAAPPLGSVRATWFDPAPPAALRLKTPAARGQRPAADAPARCSATRRGGGSSDSGDDLAPPRRRRNADAHWEPPGGDFAAVPDDTETFPDGGELLRPWTRLPAATRSLLGLTAIFLLGPVTVNLCLRLTLVDPLVRAVQGDVHFHLALTDAQYDEVAAKVDELREVLEYDAVMGRGIGAAAAPAAAGRDDAMAAVRGASRAAPPVAGGVGSAGRGGGSAAATARAAVTAEEAKLEAALKEEGLRLEHEQRERSLHVVVDTMSDAGTFFIMLTLGLSYGKDVEALRRTFAARFFEQEVSKQAFALVLLADMFVGYHSQEGWVTFLELLYSRYTLLDVEEAKAAISLFVAVVPVTLNVGLKLWFYKHLRRMSPGTQIVLSEVGRN